MKREKTLSLFAFRHQMPKEALAGSVFRTIRDPTNLNVLMDQAHESLKDCCKLTLYVTGLTTALVTVINYCQYNSIPLTLMHYDKNSGDYFPQKVFIREEDKEIKNE